MIQRAIELCVSRLARFLLGFEPQPNSQIGITLQATKIASLEFE